MQYLFRWMKILAIWGFVFVSPLSANAEIMQVGFFKLAPHAFIGSDNTAQGAAIIYFKLISAQMGADDILFSEFPLKRLLKDLEKNKLDAAIALGKNSERAAKFVYPKLPFHTMRAAIVLKREHPLNKITGVEDLLNLVIGVYEKGYYSPMMRDKRLKLIPMNLEDVVDKGYKMMLMNRIDAFYAPDSYDLEYKLIRGDYEHKLRLLLLPEPETGLFTVFSKAGAEKYLKKYEAALDIVREKKPYTEVLEEFLKHKGLTN